MREVRKGGSNQPREPDEPFEPLEQNLTNHPNPTNLPNHSFNSLCSCLCLYTRSTAMAMPSPPLTHIVAMPRVAPRRSIS